MDNIAFTPAARGAFVAFAYFMGIWFILAVVWLWNLRQERVGRLALTRRTRVIGFSICSVLYVATIHWWLFASTVYEVTVDRNAGSINLTLLVPERTVKLERSQIKSIKITPGPKSGNLFVIETIGGRSYQSPSTLTNEEIAKIVHHLKEAVGVESS